MESRILIFESKKSKLYRIDDSEWGKPVLLKILNYEFPTPQEINQFYNEYEILSELSIPGVRKPLKRTKYKGRHCMYLEWIEGKTLTDSFKGKQNDIADFLHLAISMASGIGELHSKNIVHKDLNPNNLLVNLQEREVKIISFGIASKIDFKEQHLGNPENLEGTLTYMSPEQTGRMNRVVDYRTDLYSLGITFYEMLTGSPPFEHKDALEIVHSHLTLTPRQVSRVNKQVPKVISDIVDTLLSKKAEDRYQSAFGLKQDLEACLQGIEKKKKIEPFQLRSNDFSGRFSLPQKIYGRDSELNTLFRKFEKAAQGGLETVLVAGYSGTGKSVLVREIHRPITEKKGYFIEGKFDQFQRAVPYYAFLQAFNEFINIILTEKKEKYDSIKSRITETLGEEGKVLTDVLPAMELIIGPQKEVPELAGAEAQHRFKYVFRKFITSLSTAENPLVLFIDDLQWADSSSLGLLETLNSDPDNGFLLCIGAYRDNEVTPSHPLMTTIEDLKEKGANIETIKIDNLPLDDINDLIADSLLQSKQNCLDLTELVYEKTRGNAFFITQFLNSLYAEQLLFFNYEEKQWNYSLQLIKEKNISDNVVELIAGKAKKLPEKAQNALKLASCIGNTFEIEMLAIIDESSPGETLKELQIALAESLILPNGEQYKFAHDRIQQAVYSLIPEKEKNNLHLKIGRLLLHNLGQAKIDDHLFDIVNQLNWGISLLSSTEEQDHLADLNLKAGKKAKESSAFKVAYDYLSNGISLQSPDAWTKQYKVTLDLYTLAAETAYLNGDFDQMNLHITSVLDNSTELLDKVKVYEIRILSFKAENKLLDAINTGLELLNQLGERFPKNPKLPHVMVNLIKTKLKLRGKSITHLENLPIMENEQKIAAMRIIADIASCSYWATPNLFPLLMFRMVNLCLKYGNTALSSFAFSTYGVIMCGVLGQMKVGYEFGKLGLILLEKFKAKEWKAQVYTPIYCLIVNWNEHIDKTLKPLQESYHIGLETGAIEFACINTNIYCIHAYLSGKSLERLEIETKAYSQSFARFKQETNFNYNEVYRQPMLNLMGKSADPTIMTGEAFDEEKMMRQNDERNDRTGQFFIHFNKLILCYIFKDFEKAIHHAAEARKLLEAVLAKFEIPNHHFYEALSMLALYDKATSKERRNFMNRINKSMRQIKKWSKDAPENFQHKYDLLKAEKMRVTKKHNKIGLLYDKAIKGASENQFIHEEAMIHELAGKYYLSINSENLTEFYLKESYNAFREWGAQAKLVSLEQEYPQYVSGMSRYEGAGKEMGVDTKSSTISSGAFLDINTVLKSSSTISSEIVLEKLLRTLIKIVMENAGADRGILLLRSEDDFVIQAIATDSGNKIEVMQNLDYENSGLLAERVISFVTQSKKSLVIQDAQNDIRYLGDSYVKESEVQSILSLPIVNRGINTGILYLENSLTSGAFKQDRIELLSLLSSQIAVSIENALLYENLEQKVEERTNQLAEEKKKSDKLLLNILPVEIAEELKSKGTTTPKKFEKVTVMFTDFKGFTKLSENLSPEELVKNIDTCFSAFDRIIGKYGLEKIKTIGDSYMCVGGLPIENSTHAEDAVNAALEIIQFMKEQREKSKVKNSPVFEIRVGLHTGPVIAGVVGFKKFVYDIWGDTVNTASRMESSGTEGKINVSGTTYEIIKEKYNCSYRGKVQAKSKGEVEMYFVESLRK